MVARRVFLVFAFHLDEKLSNSRQGLKCESQIALNTVQRCAKYAEASLKIRSICLTMTL